MERNGLKPMLKRDAREEEPENPSTSMDEAVREFATDDGLPCEADPGFQARLREKLWALVQRNARAARARKARREDASGARGTAARAPQETPGGEPERGEFDY